MEKMTALQVNYYVRTTGERQFDYDLDYKVFKDENHQPIQSFIDALYQINEENAVLLEDDLVLCKNFKEEIEKVINQYPNDIINFFTLPHKFFTTHYATSFCYNQCTYYPKGTTKKIADEIKKLWNTNYRQAYDTLENKALENLNIYHLKYRPCLVQHIDGKSIINNGAHCERNTIYFKDYLDNLKIDYLNSYTQKNQDRLYILLDNDRKKWYSGYNK